MIQNDKHVNVWMGS